MMGCSYSDGLTQEQQEDILAIVLRLNGKAPDDRAAKAAAEAELTLLELGEWPDKMRRYARKLMERADDNTLAPITQRRTLWSSHAAMFPLFSVAAVKLLSVHVTSAAAERNWSAWGRIYTNIRNRLGIDKARKMVYIKANFDDDSEDENDRDLEY